MMQAAAIGLTISATGVRGLREQDRTRGFALRTMTQRSDQPVTELLAKWRAGDEAALAELTAILYDQLRRLAQQHLRKERRDHTIQSTALVHEAFLQLAKQQEVDWRGRGHFFALASTLMRRILVDHARARLASKRGGGAVAIDLDHVADVEAPHPADHTDEDVGAIDQALTLLAQIDARQAQIVEMRYFGGLSITETAEALELSEATVKRDWMLARAWLRRELSRSE
jgi:RNA polymerase sigma factor (TIGR02999 family)